MFLLPPEEPLSEDVPPEVWESPVEAEPLLLPPQAAKASSRTQESRIDKIFLFMFIPLSKNVV